MEKSRISRCPMRQVDTDPRKADRGGMYDEKFNQVKNCK